MDSQPVDAHPPQRPAAGMLVVTVDRLPAWMLGSYGATWVATPALDSLAARGVVFDRVIVPTTSAGASAPVPGTYDSLFAAGDATPLLGAAASRDWRPCVVTDDPRVPRPELPGLSDTVEVRLVPPAPAGDVAADDRDTAIARLVDAAVERLAAGGTRFLWCHVGSLGMTWDAPDSHRQRYIDPDDPQPPAGAAVASLAVDAFTDPDRIVGARQVFAGQLTLLDGQLERLFAAVRDRERTDGGGWAVLVVGIRGLPLGLHGLVGVREDDLPYGEVVHVPAILVDPAGRMAAQRHGPLVTPADLGCTLAELIGAQAGRTAAAEPWRGASLLGLFRDWSAPHRDRVVVVGPTAAAVVTSRWHCLATPASGAEARRIRLFTKPDDFFEQVDVADRCADVAAALGDLATAAHRGDLTRAWTAPLPPDAAG